MLLHGRHCAGFCAGSGQDHTDLHHYREPHADIYTHLHRDSHPDGDRLTNGQHHTQPQHVSQRHHLADPHSHTVCDRHGYLYAKRHTVRNADSDADRYRAAARTQSVMTSSLSTCEADGRLSLSRPKHTSYD